MISAAAAATAADAAAADDDDDDDVSDDVDYQRDYVVDDVAVIMVDRQRVKLVLDLLYMA